MPFRFIAFYRDLPSHKLNVYPLSSDSDRGFDVTELCYLVPLYV